MSKRKKPRRAPKISSKRITIRLTPAESSLLRSQAETLHIPIAELVRRLALRGQQ